jgi:hypothetical protein
MAPDSKATPKETPITQTPPPIKADPKPGPIAPTAPPPAK